MHLSSREIWTALHGMVFGAGFLLLFSGGFFAIRSLRREYLSEAGVWQHLRRLAFASWTMAILAWLTVLMGTYWSYPWYRAKAPASIARAELVDYPKYYLMANPQTQEWHEFGMEWKEHIAWLVPMLLTAVAFVVSVHGRQLVDNTRLRRAVLMLFTVAFFSAGVAGALGALITKAAPVR